MNNIYGVLKDKKCVACGACAGVCPVDAIVVTYNTKDGFYRPVLDTEKCIGCGKCMKSCPAEHWESSDNMGEFLQIHLAHSTDPKVRHWATSGGVVNALVQYLLDKNYVEGVLMSGYSADSPIEADAFLLTRDTTFELKKHPRNYASRYVVVPVLAKMKEVKSMKSIAVVGTPCQMLSLKMGGVVITWMFLKLG